MPDLIERHKNPVPDFEKKLEMSKQGLDPTALRTIRCPYCQHYLLDVYGHDHYFVRVKCRKCKFDDVIDTALFRTLGRRRISRSLWRKGRGMRCDTVFM